NTLRSRNVSIVAAIQSIAQIKANYDKDADSVLSGFSTKILMPAIDFQDAEWASKETGTMTIRYQTKNTGRSRRVVDNFANVNSGKTEMVQQRAVLTPDEIGRPVDNIATFFLPNTPVFQGHISPYYEIKEMREKIATKAEVQMRTEALEFEEKDPEPLPVQGAQVAAGPKLSDEEIAAQLEDKREKLGWSQTSGVAREWWESFETQNAGKKALILTLFDELLRRESTIYEFFLSYVYSSSESIEDNLKFLDRMIEAYKSGGDTTDESLKEAVSYM
ncbi:MAG: TraM recognition domain-containing protein, partial [bacterium]|nr:TraM recognition domain-containing protein [bacterium]